MTLANRNCNTQKKSILESKLILFAFFFLCFQKCLKIISVINFTVPFPKLAPFFPHS